MLFAEDMPGAKNTDRHNEIGGSYLWPGKRM